MRLSAERRSHSVMGTAVPIAFIIVGRPGAAVFGGAAVRRAAGTIVSSRFARALVGTLETLRCPLPFVPTVARVVMAIVSSDLRVIRSYWRWWRRQAERPVKKRPSSEQAERCAIAGTSDGRARSTVKRGYEHGH